MQTCKRMWECFSGAPRYVEQQNRILSDYPTLWPKEKLSVKKDEVYDLTPALET